MVTQSLHRGTALLCLCLGAIPLGTPAETLRASRQQGAVHAFLLIRDAAGKVIGTGDEVNMRSGNQWRSRLTLKFADGSIDDETALYVQHTTVKLLTDHHIQKGPSYPKPLDMSIDASKGSVTWHEWKDGAEKVKTETIALPSDVCNGLLPVVMQNLPTGGTETKLAYVVATPSPRVVTLAIHPDAPDRFRIGGLQRTASRYRVHMELGGVTGLVAPLIGKEPPDMYLWVAQGQVPTFLRLNGALFEGGPTWSVELSSPIWNAAGAV